MGNDLKIDPAWIETLLTATEREAASQLKERNLLTPEGLSQLLHQAGELVRRNPGQARRLASLCATLAGPAGAPAAVPRAHYICAQAHAINGELQIALDLIRSARDAYTALGEHLEALRTNVGLMHILNELGRHQEALDIGQTMLNLLQQTTWQEITSDEALRLLAALVNQNCGLCYEFMGRYDDALTAYAVAEAHYRELDMTERVSDILNNRGIVLLNLGRGSEALAAFQQAAAIRKAAGQTLLYAQSLINVGDAHLLLGNYAASLAAFEEARRHLQTLDALAEYHILLLDTADAYLALNLYPEALSAYQEANAMLSQAGMAHHRARALWGMGSALMALTRYTEAAQVLQQAAELFEASGNTPLLSSVMLEQAALLMVRGNRTAALEKAGQALDLATAHSWPVQQFYAHLRLADLHLPDVAAAEPHLLAAQRLAGELGLPHLHYRVNQRLGRLRRLQGREEEAQILLETALAGIEHLRGTLAQEAMRTSFLRDKVVVYEELVQLLLDRGEPESIQQAFAVAERAKSRTLVDLLTGAVSSPVPASNEQKPASQLQAWQADLNAIYNELLGGSSSRQVELRYDELQARAIQLEHLISRQHLQSDLAISPYDPFDTPVMLEESLAHLPTDLTVLAYHIIEDEILAFVRREGRIHVVRHLSTVPTIQALVQRLAVQWDRFRAGRSFVQQHMPLLEKSTRRVLEALHQALIAPLTSLLQPPTPSDTDGVAHPLAIIPHGLLHQIPFHALYDGQQYMIDQYEISYAPNTTVLALCQAQPATPWERALIFGVPDPLIPAITTETQMIARHLPYAEIRLEETATLSAFRARAPGCSALHLACHGLFRADNPMFSSLKFHDGWLMAVDVISLDLQGAFVTLSACETGRSQVIGGDETIGLTRAFLGAGASTLVVSLWVVQDETTATLMADLYSHLQHQARRTAALRAAQLALKAYHPHPYYWAPFILVGKR